MESEPATWNVFGYENGNAPLASVLPVMGALPPDTPVSVTVTAAFATGWFCPSLTKTVPENDVCPGSTSVDEAGTMVTVCGTLGGVHVAPFAVASAMMALARDTIADG